LAGVGTVFTVYSLSTRTRRLWLLRAGRIEGYEDRWSAKTGGKITNVAVRKEMAKSGKQQIDDADLVRPTAG